MDELPICHQNYAGATLWSQHTHTTPSFGKPTGKLTYVSRFTQHPDRRPQALRLGQEDSSRHSWLEFS